MDKATTERLVRIRGRSREGSGLSLAEEEFLFSLIDQLTADVSVQRKAEALDWLERTNAEISVVPFQSARRWSVTVGQNIEGVGETLLDAIEDAMREEEDYIPAGHHIVEDADGCRYVKNPSELAAPTLLSEILEAVETIARLHGKATAFGQHVVASKLDCAFFELRSAVGCWNRGISDNAQLTDGGPKTL